MLTRDLSRQTMQWIGGLALLGWLLLAAVLLTGFISSSSGGIGTTPTWDATVTQGREVTSANTANPLVVGKASGDADAQKVCIYSDTTTGEPQVRACAPADSLRICETNFDCGLYDDENSEAILTCDPDAIALGQGRCTFRDNIAGPMQAQTPNSQAGAYTIGTDDTDECYGGLIPVTVAATITACDNLAAGMNFSVYTIGAIAVSLDVQADDRMRLDGTALDDGDRATNTSTAGDMITCWYESAAGWDCMSNSWTDGGP